MAYKDGVIQNAFNAEQDGEISEFILDSDLVDISNNFNIGGKKSLFENTGMMIDGEVTTLKTFPVYVAITLTKLFKRAKLMMNFISQNQSYHNGNT